MTPDADKTATPTWVASSDGYEERPNRRIDRLADTGLPEGRDFPIQASKSVRQFVLGGVLGPVAFVAAWLVNGLVKARYSALHDPISELASVHASTRLAMSAGFVLFTLGLCFYAFALHAALPGPAWIAAATTGLATLGVAAFPLHHSSTIDNLHGAFASVGYITLALTALLSAPQLARRGLHTWARAATIAGVVSAIALALTLVGSYDGLFQRIGLTAGDIWVVASALAIRRGWWVSSSAPLG